MSLDAEEEVADVTGTSRFCFFGDGCSSKSQADIFLTKVLGEFCRVTNEVMALSLWSNFFEIGFLHEKSRDFRDASSDGEDSLVESFVFFSNPSRLNPTMACCGP